MANFLIDLVSFLVFFLLVLVIMKVVFDAPTWGAYGFAYLSAQISMNQTRLTELFKDNCSNT